MINQCPECGGQNAMHYTSCPHAPAMPRVSALRTALPTPTATGKLPYMHQQHATGHEAIFGTNGSMGGDLEEDFPLTISPKLREMMHPDPLQPADLADVQPSWYCSQCEQLVHSQCGDSACRGPGTSHLPTAGRLTQESPQIQNFPGTLAAAMEMHEAKHGPDPSIRLSTCPAKEETLIMKVTNHIGKHPFTHRDKGGLYKLTCISKPAGETMRKVGVTVIYHDVGTRQQYSRDLEDFVRIMVPIPD